MKFPLEQRCPLGYHPHCSRLGAQPQQHNHWRKTGGGGDREEKGTPNLSWPAPQTDGSSFFLSWGERRQESGSNTWIVIWGFHWVTQTMHQWNSINSENSVYLYNLGETGFPAIARIKIKFLNVLDTGNVPGVALLNLNSGLRIIPKKFSREMQQYNVASCFLWEKDCPLVNKFFSCFKCPNDLLGDNGVRWGLLF